jgi:hypothetical protein
MAVTHHIVELNNASPVAISVIGNHTGRDITIQNIDNSANVYLGGPNVTTTDFGYRLAPNTAWSVELRKEEVIYAVSSSTSDVAVLELGLESFNG